MNSISFEAPQHQINSFIDTFCNFAPKFIDLYDLKKTGLGIYRRYMNGSIYYGEIVNGKRHGKGMLINADKVYAGDWQNDLKHGLGSEQFPNKQTYEGSYVNGKQDGHGIYNWTDGSQYKGQWSSGMKHGKGLWRSKDGQQSFEGEWRFGQAEGYGVLVQQNQDCYAGEFRKSLKYGVGKEIFHNGDIYQGDFVNGKPEGKGLYIWNDEIYYEGEFRNGLRHGLGFWSEKPKDSMTAGSTYKGEYSNDMKCGSGVYKWRNGNFYKGNFFNDKRQGYGEMYWVDGSYYKGQWEDGIQNGDGELVMQMCQTFTFKHGLQRGLFVDNKLVSSSSSDKQENDSPFHPFIQLSSQLKNDQFIEPKIGERKRNHQKVPKITIIHKTLFDQPPVKIPYTFNKATEFFEQSRYFKTQIEEEGDVKSFLSKRNIVVRSDEKSSQIRSRSVNNSSVPVRQRQYIQALESNYDSNQRHYTSPKVWKPSGRFKQQEFL